MYTLTWTHTRKKIPMSLVGTWAQIQIKIWMIRHVFPKHPMYINGDPV
jgi:hypothetical protein